MPINLLRSKSLSKEVIGMNKKYIVRLTEDERKQLEGIIKKGKAPAYKIKHAHILLDTDADKQEKVTGSFFLTQGKTFK